MVPDVKAMCDFLDAEILEHNQWFTDAYLAGRMKCTPAPDPSITVRFNIDITFPIAIRFCSIGDNPNS